MAAIEKFGPNSPGHLPPQAGGQKPLFGTNFETLSEHISATEHDIKNWKQTCQSTWTSLHAPNLTNFGRETAKNG